MEQGCFIGKGDRRVGGTLEPRRFEDFEIIGNIYENPELLK